MNSKGCNESYITYMQEFLKVLDVIGNKKATILRYLIKEMNKSNNILVITTEELANRTNSSRQTVSDLLGQLEQAELIKRKVGSIMVNPKLINKMQ